MRRGAKTISFLYVDISINIKTKRESREKLRRHEFFVELSVTGRGRRRIEGDGPAVGKAASSGCGGSDRPLPEPPRLGPAGPVLYCLNRSARETGDWRLEAEGRRQKAEGRRRKAEGERQKAVGGKRKAEGRKAEYI